MKHFFAMLALTIPLTGGASEEAAIALAKSVVSASGGDSWSAVQTIDFTFNVEEKGKIVASAQHHWDVRGNRDVVTWNGKSVVVDLSNPAPEAKPAFARWVNDSYWLLAPLKLLDRGVDLTSLDPLTMEGKKLDGLHAQFQAVGLTPGDAYNFYIDPATHLVARWDYMPGPGKKVSGTWEKYEEFGGLKLATDHQFGDKRIFFSGIKVQRD